ncbi:tripartite tricarboxylate transporter TctB family protein [Ornithinimicrobium sp. W1679]|uniref:tripartite tricarboxylate transporter TctB family protein n=1 Tax=Ornithinimicrobium sp. W1679 TaxID=3418770 RepID=UPI003CF384AF
MTGADEPVLAQERGPARADVVGTVLVLVVGLVVAVMGWGYGFQRENGQVGPGFLPVLTGGFVVVASALELLRMFLAPTSPVEGSFMEGVEKVEALAKEELDRARSETRGASGEALDVFGRSHKQRGRAVQLVFGTMFLAILLIPVLGLLLSMTLMTFVILRFIESKGWVISAAVSAGAFLFFFLIFRLALGLPLPTGMLGLV